MSIYLDWNATTPPHPDVLRAIQEAQEDAWANPASVHGPGRRARDRVEGVRERLAALLGFDSRDVVLTSGGTEANHLALEGCTHLVTSWLDHPSIAVHAQLLAQRGSRVAHASPDAAGRLSAHAVEDALVQVTGGRPEASPGERRVVSVTAANHETGVLQPVGSLAEVARRFGARLHVDAVQLLGRGDLSELRHADSVSVASHKIRGPKGVGALAFVCGYQPQPLGRGGAQERGLRPGTVDAAAVAGFGAALERVQDSQARYVALESLRDRLEQALAARRASLHGARAPRLPHVSNFRLPDWRGDELVVALDLEGIAVSSGSACSAGTAEPSAVIAAMLGREAATGAVRVSLGELTSSSDVDAFLSALDRILGTG